MLERGEKTGSDLGEEGEMRTGFASGPVFKSGRSAGRCAMNAGGALLQSTTRGRASNWLWAGLRSQPLPGIILHFGPQATLKAT